MRYIAGFWLLPLQVGILCLLLLAMGGATRAGEQPKREKFKRRAETTIRYSSDRHLNISEVWQPVWASGDELIYASVRSMADNLDNFEGNVGLGYRRFMGDHVRGGYGYIDRRTTALGSDFWQMTLGAEYMRENWEARANIYVPVNPTRTYTDATASGPFISGTGVYVREPGELVEEARAGGDAEVGFTLPDVADFMGQVRVYGGGYYFHGQKTDDLVGARTRVEAEVTEWFKLGARAQYDEERDAQFFIEATLRWPRVKTTKTLGLWARMSDTPERDVDIVTGEVATDGPAQAVIDTTTGLPVQFVYVDNTATSGGNGSAEKPYQGLSDALAHTTPHDIVYVAAGDGTTNGYDQGYTLATSGVTVMGSGSPLLLNGDRYRAGTTTWIGDLVVRAAGTAPLITNTSGDVMTISAHDVTLQGLQIDAGNGNGVVIGTGADDVVIDNVAITGNTQNGVYIQNTVAPAINIRVRNSVVSGNLLSGIRTETTGGAVHLDLGHAGDYGFNDIFGNIGDEMTVQNGDVGLSARGNYWGGGALTRLSGANQGTVDASVYVTNSFCTDCAVSNITFSNMTDVVEGARVTTAAETLEGFRGHRYVRAYGDGAPEWVKNGSATGTGIISVAAADQIALRVTPNTTGYETQFVNVTGAGLSGAIQVQTRFLPNMYNTLIGWWDGRDVDGDFITSDNPANGTFISSWVDKTGYGHEGTAVGSTRPVYNAATGYLDVDGHDDRMDVDNSFLLSALNNGASVAMVIKGQPTGPDTSVFSYGTCTAGAGSRCFAVQQDGTSGNVQLRLDTSAAQNQMVGNVPLFDGQPHLLWVSASGAGQVDMRVDGVNVVSAAYTPGAGGFWNTGGLDLMGAINGGYGEILLFNGVPSGSSRDLVEEYLANKWGF